ncbi:MAG: DUF4349 domain-containing protein [Microbacteriaceae bacterium]
MGITQLETERIEAMQHNVMDGVAKVQQRRQRRTRAITASFGLVAVLSLAGIVGNQLIPGSSSDTAFRSADMSAGAPEMSQQYSSVGPEALLPPAQDSRDGAGQNSVTQKTDRLVIRTANLTMVSKNIPEDMNTVTSLITQYDGYVEQTMQSNLPSNTQASDSKAYADIRPDYYGQSYLVARVPSASLDAFINELRPIAEVQNLNIQQQDVTAEVQDIDARIHSLKLSIERLQSLISTASSTQDLLSAEEQLTQRQGELESQESLQKLYSTQVSMSQVQITFSESAKPAELAPDGLLGGLLTGWNSLVTALGGMIVGFGVILPWLVVIGLVWFAIWGVNRMRKAKKKQA